MVAFHNPLAVGTLREYVLSAFQFRENLIPAGIVINTLHLIVADGNLAGADDPRYCGGVSVCIEIHSTRQSYARHKGF